MKLPIHPTWLFLSMTLAVCAPAVPCELTDFQSLAEESPHGVTLASAERVDDAGGYCLLEGVIANADDGESRIRFRFRFPDAAAWNGRFLMGGNGGSAGRFQRDHLSLLALELGYATGQTDTGHVQSSSEDWVVKELADGTVVPNHVAIEDFGHRSVHLTTVVGKQFAEGYYARAPDHSYFRGCSTGGRQGLMAMQRYPGDFDGIIAGAPVFSPARMIVAGLWTTQQVARLIAEDQPLAGEQLDLLQDAVLDACDAIDGVEDQIIDDPRQCRVDPGILQCSESESPPQCLTDSQVEFVRTIYDGPVTTSGERIYPGLLHGGEYGRGMGVGGWARFTAGECATQEE
ncbi:MAG: tannase/feruloyl esterase family alpha/beta hydrolase [Proteobacteria bacterium]|nr:tannase/feruloyl esterase family alpha/beta hydrolase [Pseudomonadota bacterium]